MIMDLNDLRTDILIEGIEDYVGLWQIVRRVRNLSPGASDGEIREATLGIIPSLLADGYVRPIDPPYQGGEPWISSARKASGESKPNGQS